MAKASPLKLGIFVTITCVLFIYALLRVSDGLDFFGNTITVYANFKDVKGLQTGNNVRFSGIGVGEVKAITIKNDTTLTVQMELDAQVKDFLRKNAAVDIASDGLVGNKIISMHPGEGEADFIEPEDILSSPPTAEITDMLAELSHTNEKITAITENLLAVSEKMNSGQGTLGLLLNDQSLANNLLSTSEHLQETTKNFHRTSQGFNQLMAGVSQGDGNLGYLLQSDGLKEEVDRLGNNLDTLVRVRTEAIFKELARTSSSLRSSSEKVDVLIRELTEEEGIVRTLVKDTTAANHLKATLVNLDKGTKEFAINMEALQDHWLLRGAFKRKAKQERKAIKKEL